MSKRTNEEWLNDLRSDGPEHNDAIADLHDILLKGLQRGLLSRVNTHVPEFHTQAEDFVQEAILRILDKLDTFAGRSMFTTWAHKVAVSVALTELRRKRWQDYSLDGIVEAADGDYTPQFAADPDPTPESSVERAEMVAQVDRIIQEELTDKQRRALVLSVIKDLPTPVVAKEMDMKPNALYKLLHDARVRLKNRLTVEGMSPGDVLAVFE